MNQQAAFLPYGATHPSRGGHAVGGADPFASDNAAALLGGIPPGEAFDARLAAVEHAPNPLLEAARPLLRAIADMPAQLELREIDQLHLLLKQETRVFQRLCEQANIRRDHMVDARYCLCTALDEAAMQTEWGQRETGVRWITTGLATEFHEDRHGSEKIYLLIGRLMRSPREHLDLLEVVYRMLSLGFLAAIGTNWTARARTTRCARASTANCGAVRPCRDGAVAQRAPRRARQAPVDPRVSRVGVVRDGGRAARGHVRLVQVSIARTRQCARTAHRRDRSAIGRGAADPVGDNKTLQGRAQNRRVAISVTP